MNTPRPQLCIGQVRHSRLRPAMNAFSYGVFTLMLPLRAIGDGPLGSKLCARNRFHLLSFHDRDHGDGKTPLLPWIETLLRTEGIADADGEIWLQTFPRVLGYVFNPVSFWFCHRQDDTLRAILVEINSNHGTRHCYLLENEGDMLRWGAELQAKKVFQVSQLSKIEGDYRFRFLRTTRSEQGAAVERIVSHVEYHDNEGLLISASISGEVKPLSDLRLAWAFFRYPLMTLAVFARIHWQTLKLLVRGVPYYGRRGTP